MADDESADRFYIQATSSLAEDSSLVLKHGETFGVFDPYGDLDPLGTRGRAQGLYHEGTRHLSRLVLLLGDDRPLFLSSTVRDNNLLLTVDLTNPDLHVEGELVLPRGTLHLLRTKFLWHGICYESLQIRNYGEGAVDVALRLALDADFADIFEVRGTHRDRRGERLPTLVHTESTTLAYRGLDGVVRFTNVVCAPPPTLTSVSEMRFDVALQPGEQSAIYLSIGCQAPHPAAGASVHEQAYAEAAASLTRLRDLECEVTTANEEFNDLVNRSLADLRIMMADTASGLYPHAGVPWYSAVFGRDGIITALETLWVNPALARGVLRFLSDTQADSIDPLRDAEPGKMVHEMRKGEMATLGEIPFGRYYGSVDATPLFVILAAAYYEATADRGLIEDLWDSIERALAWIEEYGDMDGDGFVEYLRRSPHGLTNQGWKDSHDSVFHADGTLADGPIALCEVQGYVYAAKRGASELARVLGHADRADELARQSKRLQERFEEVFWCEDLSIYALALDRQKRSCHVRTSNAGHCLFTGIASPERAQRTARTLLSDEFFSGWGVRTVATAERRFNPMSYHNGSVWPHDNALIAYGLSRYGHQDLAVRILAGIFDASQFIDLHRLPELFCGFPRRPGEAPTLYPVACAPQAWASAAVFMLLQAALGMTLDAPRRQIRFVRPQLPAFLEEVDLRNLRVGQASIDIRLHRYHGDVGINVLRREGDVEVVNLK